MAHVAIIWHITLYNVVKIKWHNQLVYVLLECFSKTIYYSQLLRILYSKTVGGTKHWVNLANCWQIVKVFSLKSLVSICQLFGHSPNLSPPNSLNSEFAYVSLYTLIDCRKKRMGRDKFSKFHTYVLWWTFLSLLKWVYSMLSIKVQF